MSKDFSTFKVLDQALGGWTYVVWAIFFSNRNLNIERFIFLGTNDRKPWLQTIKIGKHSRNCIKSQDYNERLHEKFMKIVLPRIPPRKRKAETEAEADHICESLVFVLCTFCCSHLLL
jgi:hypothetical protein